MNRYIDSEIILTRKIKVYCICLCNDNNYNAAFLDYSIYAFRL